MCPHCLENKNIPNPSNQPAIKAPSKVLKTKHQTHAQTPQNTQGRLSSNSSLGVFRNHLSRLDNLPRQGQSLVNAEKGSGRTPSGLQAHRFRRWGWAWVLHEGNIHAFLIVGVFRQVSVQPGENGVKHRAGSSSWEELYSLFRRTTH